MKSSVLENILGVFNKNEILFEHVSLDETPMEIEFTTVRFSFKGKNELHIESVIRNKFKDCCNYEFDPDYRPKPGEKLVF